MRRGKGRIKSNISRTLTLLLSFRAVLITALLSALVPALFITVLTGLEHSRALQRAAQENTLRQVEALAEIQNRITVFARQTLGMLAGLPEIRKLEPQSSTVLLMAVREANGEFLNFTLTDGVGFVVASALLSGGYDLSDRKSIQEALIGRGFCAGEYVVSRALQEPAFNFAQTVRDEKGVVVGALGAIYRLSIYDSLIRNLSLPRGSMLGITDRYGIRLFYNPPSETNPIGGRIKGDMWKILTSEGDSGTTVMTGSDGVRRIYAFKRLRLSSVDEPYMYFVLGLPEALIMAPAREVLIRNLVLIVTVLALTLGSAWILSGIGYGRRLKAIIAATDLLHAGDFSARTGLWDDNSDLGRVAGALDRMAEALELREAERVEAAAAAEKALREKDTLLREIHHRVKNNLQVVLSLVRLQQERDGGATDLAAPTETRINAMAMVHEMLYQSADLGRVDLSAYIPRLADLVMLGGTVPVGADLRVETEPLHLSLDRAVPFALVFNELLSNACKYAIRRGGGTRIDVTLRKEGGEGVLTLQDDGPGLPDGFDPQATRGLGMTLILGLTRQLGGAFRWENRGGAFFVFRFPL